jgi:phosphoribosyl 1,2-cyclic phosphodiesterase
MLNITSIASSSSGNLYLLDNGNTKLIVELGIPWKQVQKAMGFDFSQVAGALVTHEHKDHSKSVVDATRAGVDVYLSEGTAAGTRGAIGHRIHHVSSLQQFVVGDWHVMPFDIEHDAAEPLGFVIMSGRDKVLFLTDTAYCKYKFTGITKLMIECNFDNDILGRNYAAGLVEKSRYKRLLESHMSLARVKDFLTVQDTSCLVEIWLLHLSDNNSNAAQFKTTIQQLTGVPTFIA